MLFNILVADDQSSCRTLMIIPPCLGWDFAGYWLSLQMKVSWLKMNTIPLEALHPVL